MDIEIDLDKLRENKLFLASPLYNRQCTGTYAQSLFDLGKYFGKIDVHLEYHQVWHCSQIETARNIAVDRFMNSNATHMLFVDADIGFRPEDVITMLALQTPNSPYDVMGGTYMRKSIKWSLIKSAVEQGLAEEKEGGPTNLRKHASEYLFLPKIKDGKQEFLRKDGLIEVDGLPAGFMLVRRATFQLFKDKYPDLWFREDDGTQKTMYFHIDVESHNLLPEDYWFQQKIRQVGGRIWICPWVNLSHMGSFVFGGP